MTITFKIFDEAMFNIGKKLIDLNGDTFKAVLSSVAPVQATDDELADITQISGTGGYAAFSMTVTYAETGGGTGIWKFDSNDLTWTASGASFDSFRYITIYDDTSTNDKLIGFYDRGSGLVVTDGATYTLVVAAGGHVQLDATP